MISSDVVNDLVDGRGVDLATEFDLQNPSDQESRVNDIATPLIGDVSPVPSTQGYEEALKAAEEGSKISINKYGYLTQKQRYQIALVIARCSEDVFQKNNISEDIADYADLTEKQRYEIAKVAASCGRSLISKYIGNYRLTHGQNYEVALLAAAYEPIFIDYNIFDFISNYEGLNEEQKYQIFLVAAPRNYFFSKYIGKNEFLTQEQKYELAKLAAPCNGGDTFLNIGNYGDLSLEQKHQIALLAAAKNPYLVSRNIAEYHELTQEQRYEIAKVAAASGKAGVSQYIGQYGDLSGEQKYQIAMLAASYEDSLSEYIGNYTELTQEQRYEIAKAVAASGRVSVSKYIGNYGDLTLEQMHEIAKIAVRCYNSDILYIHNYRNLTQKQRYELLLKFAEQNGSLSFEAISKFKDLSQEQKYQVAKVALAQDGYISFFRIDKCEGLTEEQKGQLRLVARAQYAIKRNEVKDQSSLERFLAEKQMNELGDILQNVKEGDRSLVKCVFIGFYAFLGKERSITDMEKSVFFQILNFSNEEDKCFLWLTFLVHLQNPGYASFFSEEVDNEKTLLCRIILAKWALEGEIKNVKKILNFLKNHKKIFKDRTGAIKQFLQILLKLESDFSLSINEKIEIVEKVTTIEGENLKQEIKKYLAAVQGCISIKQSKQILGKSIKNFEDFFYKDLLSGLFCLQDGDVESLEKKYLDLETTMRIPFSLINYLAPLKSLNNSKMNETIRLFFKALLNEEEGVCAIRYNPTSSEHLRYLFDNYLEVFNKWQEGHTEAITTLFTGKEEKMDYKKILHQKIIRDCHLKNPPSVLVDYLNDRVGEIELSSIKDLNQRKIAELCLHLCISTDRHQEIIEELKKCVPKTEEFYNDLDALKAQKSDQQSKEFDLIDTDDWEHLFLSGTEVNGSCQRINGNPKFNKCLFAYIIDGKNRMVAIVDRKTRRIIARSIIRLLIEDDGSPAIFQERIYPANCTSEHMQLLESLVCEKGNLLGISVFSEGDENRSASSSLSSLGSLAAFECSDAAKPVNALSGHVFNNGVFRILV